MSGTLRILCGVSFDAAGRAALNQAIALARRTRASLCLVHCVSPDGPFRLADERELGLLRGFRQKAADAGLRVTVRIEHADIGEGISRVAKRERCNLVVVGRGARRARQRTGLHALAASVARASVPLLIVPERNGASRQVRAAFKKVLWAVGRSPLSVDAEDAVLRIVHEERRALTLLNVSEPGDPSRQLAMLRLARALSDDVRAAIRPDLEVAYGAVPETILRVASRSDADLIVVGSSGGGASASPLWSVIDLSRIPVLVLPGRANAVAPRGERLARAA